MVKEKKTRDPKQKSSKKQTRKGLIPWIGLSLFACAWMFVLGIFVGRETVPVRFDIEKLQNELAALKEKVVKKELDQYKIDSNADVTKTKMKFYETLKKTGREDSLNNHRAEQKKKSFPEKSASLSKDSLPAHRAGPTRKDTVKKPAQNTPAAVAKQAPAGKHVTIQVASLKAARDADNLVSKLKKEGYPAYRTIGKIPGKGIWFRVRVGYFKNRTEAGLMLKRLKKEKIEAVIVPR